MNKEKHLTDLAKKIEAAKRQKLAIECRTNFLDFVKYSMPDPDDPDDIEQSMFKDAKHHRALAKVLEKVEKGHIPRLIVSMPPRHGKSELISRRFVPWIQGKDPYRNVSIRYIQRRLCKRLWCRRSKHNDTATIQARFSKFWITQGWGE